MIESSHCSLFWSKRSCLSWCESGSGCDSIAGYKGPTMVLHGFYFKTWHSKRSRGDQMKILRPLGVRGGRLFGFILVQGKERHLSTWRSGMLGDGCLVSATSQRSTIFHLSSRTWWVQTRMPCLAFHAGGVVNFGCGKGR